SAMIESIEGKRGMPRLRPPYVAQVGLFGRPTLEHNMETVYWVREIVEKGAAWFAAQGRHGRKGLRSFSVSGRVRKPGVHLAPAGITLRELLDEYCGGMLQVHAVPRRHRKGSHADAGKEVEPAVARRTLTGNDGRLHLRPGPGRAQSRVERAEIFPARGAVMERVSTDQLAMMPIEFKLNGQTVVGRPDEKII